MERLHLFCYLRWRRCKTISHSHLVTLTPSLLVISILNLPCHAFCIQPIWSHFRPLVQRNPFNLDVYLPSLSPPICQLNVLGSIQPTSISLPINNLQIICLSYQTSSSLFPNFNSTIITLSWMCVEKVEISPSEYLLLVTRSRLLHSTLNSL